MRGNRCRRASASRDQCRLRCPTPTPVRRGGNSTPDTSGRRSERRHGAHHLIQSTERRGHKRRPKNSDRPVDARLRTIKGERAMKAFNLSNMAAALILTVSAGTTMVAPAGAADDFPGSQTINLVSWSAAGSPKDVMAREVAKSLKKQLGSRV